jgi:hypothetical protein
MHRLKNILIKGLTFSMLLGGSLAIQAQGADPCPNKYGSDTILTKEKLSLFNQYYQNKDYVKAYPYWKYLFDNAPCVQKRVTYNGPLIVKKYLSDLRKTNDSMYKLRKAGLVDTILMIYPKRIELYGQECYVKGKWASDWAKLKPKERQQALKMFEESVACEQNKTAYTVPMNYMKTAIKEHKKKAYSLDSLYQLYFQMMDITTYNIANTPKKKAKWESAEAFLNKVMKPYLNCEKVEEYFKPKIEANPNDTAMLKKVADLLVTAKCTRSVFFLGIAEKIYELDPSPAAAKTIAIGRHANQEYKAAAQWYEKALPGEVNDSSKAKVYMTIATLNDKRLNNLGAANKYAKEALKLNPNAAGAYIIKAKHIGSLASSCADNIKGASAYWAASDAAAKARDLAKAQGNEKLIKEANSLIGFYASKFITKEEAFFVGFTQAEGSSFTVQCTGSATIVRFKK